MTNTTATEKTVVAGKHTLTIETYGKGGTVRVNGIALCMNALKWKDVVEGVKAGKYDDYIKNYCQK